MLVISRLILILTALFSFNASAIQITEGRIGGNKPVKVENLTPGAVIMKDTNRRDVLLVFYRTHDNAKHHQVGFSIARNIDEQGMLIWDKESYILKPSTFNTGGVAPLPIVYNNSLILLGTTKVGHKKSARNRVLYTRFNSVEELINNAVGGNSSTPAIKKLMDTNRNHATLTGTVITGLNNEAQLLLAYYHPKRRQGEPEQPPFSYALCNKDMTCIEREAYRGLGHQTITNMTLYNMRMGREETILLAMRHKDSHDLILHQYFPEDDSWIKLYNVPHLTPDINPIGLAERNNTLVAYFNNDEYHNSYSKGSIIRSQISKYDAPYSGTSWLNGNSMYSNNKDKLKSDTGVSAVAFNGNIYGFYKDKHNHYGKYFREMD